MFDATQRSVLAAALLALAGAADAQVPVGQQPFNSYSGGPDIVDNASLNVQLSIPVVSKAGRGLPFSFSLVYDSSIYSPITAGVNRTWTPSSTWGWGASSNAFVGEATYSPGAGQCPNTQKGQGYLYLKYTTWRYFDPSGAVHSFPTLVVYDYSNCPNGPGNGPFSQTVTATDGSGITLYVDATPSAIAYLSSGVQFVPPLQSQSGSGTIWDPNGNSLSTNGTTFTDSLGMTALTISGNSYQYTAAGNVAEQVTVKYSSPPVNILTKFGCSGISEYSANNVSLVSEVDLPDLSKYTFTYETTPGHSGYYTGRIASITLPTGAEIAYAYQGSNNGINCADGSVPQLQRTVSGSNVLTGVWTYARSQVSGSEWETVITDPQSTTTTIYTQGPTNSTGPYSAYEVERVVKNSGGTTYLTVDTCYNGASVPCTGTSTSPPFSNQTVQTTVPGLGASKVYTTLNAYELPTEIDEYDWGGSSAARKTTISYASPGNYINDRPQAVQIYNSGGTSVSQKSYTWDSAGNLKTASYSGQNMGTLSKSYSYGSYGLLSSITDFNSAVTSYSSYQSCNSQSAFPSTISLPVNSLSISMAWDCYGGVTSSVTGENGGHTSLSYTTDPFSRPMSSTDPAGAATGLSYSPTAFEGTLNFNNGASTSDGLTTLDPLGRRLVAQRRQGPGSSTFDSVETDYDAMGHPNRVTVPYSGTAGATCSTCAATVVNSFDPLGRPLSVTDGGGGAITYSYNANDVLKTVGPAPNGEHQELAVRT